MCHLPPQKPAAYIGKKDKGYVGKWEKEQERAVTGSSAGGSMAWGCAEGGASGAQVANLSVGTGSSRSGEQAAFPGELQVPLATPSQAQICFLQSKQSQLTERVSYLL